MALIRQSTPKDAIVTFVKGEGAFLKFWALPVTAVDTLKKLENHLTKIGGDLANSSGFSNYNQVPVGYTCAVFSKSRRAWVRARVLNVLSFSEFAVQLIDYGNEERVSIDEVRQLDASLFQTKGQAVECILADVRPAFEEWSPDAVRFCESQLLYQTVSCFVVSHYAEVPIVRIAKKGEKEPFVQRLINSGLAYIKPEAPPQQQPIRPALNYKMNMLDRNTTHLVKVACSENPFKFYVQLAAAEVELNKLMDDLRVYVSTESFVPVNSPQLDTPCLAVFSGNHVFCRASIKSVAQNQFSVFFVDYGYSEAKLYKDLRAIPNRYLQLPAQAICCSLPKEEVSMEEFRRIISCGLLECHIIGHGGSPNNMTHIVRLASHMQQPLMQRPFPPTMPQVLTYQRQKLDVNTTYDVTVSFTNDITEFYSQLTQFKEQLDNLSNVLNSGCELEPLSLVDCVPNMPVCVKFSEDLAWYRAQIVKVNHEHDIEVFFVDYGNYDNATLRDVRRMKPDLMVLPIQAYKCCLYGVELPQDTSQKDSMFDMFEELTASQNLVAHVHSITDDQSYALTLHDRNSPTSINEKLMPKVSNIPTVPVSDVEQLYITYFNSPSSFFAQFEKLSMKKLEEMQIEINDLYADARNTSFKPNSGDFVCAKFSMDNSFYRARVEKIVGINCNVTFVDYGNKETIPLSDIHPIEKKFMNYPQFGIECGLLTYPPATPVEKLQSLMAENSIQAKMVKEDNEKWLITLTEDFNGNVAILELLRQHETVVPRSIHGAGLRGFQERITKREETISASNEFKQPRGGYQNSVKLDSSRPPRNSEPFNKSERSFSPPVKEERKETWSSGKSFEVTSIPPKAYRNVYVSHVISPSEFYCQVEEESTKLQVLMKSIEDTYSNLNDNEMKLHNLDINSPCCAMFQEDEAWYRAQIKEVGPKTCNVYFIDYGNTDVVPVSKIKELQREFFNLPPQAICCKSYNVSPKSGSWSDNDIDTFIEMTLEKSFVAQFVESDKNGTYAVNLVSIGKLQDDVLNKEFVSLGHGRLEDASKIIVMNSHTVSSNLTFPVPVVNPGSFENVTVTFGLNPGEVFCQLKSSETDFKKMMLEMQNYYKEVSVAEAMIDRPHPGMICVCQFSLDSVWYRGEIKKVEKNSLDVLYVDYGNKEIVDKKKIRSITQDFTLLPIQGIKCHLRGIKPPGKTWTLNNNLGQYFEGDVQCKFISKLEDSYLVDMTCNKENVALKLVKSGLASADAPLEEQEVVSRTVKAAKPQPVSTTKFLKREMTFVSGQLLSVTVSFIESPFKFWCQLVDEAELLEKLMADIESHYVDEGAHPIDATALGPGAYCMAKYSADEAWYRAQVKSCGLEKYEVFFIDYGNSEATSLNQLAAILPEFLSTPPLCFECRLARAPPKCENTKTEEFQSVVDEAEEITAKVECSVNDMYILTLLFEKEGEEVNLSDHLFGFHEDIPTSLSAEVPKFLPPDVPLGQQEGYVTVVNTPHDFFIQLATSEDNLDELATELSQCESDGETAFVQNPCIGYACCAQFSEDNNWYRAEVTDVQGTTVDVLFVDYGNTSSVDKNLLKPMDKKLLDIPPYAMRCKLNGITSTSDQWSDAAVDAFQDMVLDSPLGITFISKDIPAIVNISKEDKDVAQSLIDMELAIVDTCPETEEAYADDHLTTVEDQLHSLPSDLSYPQRKLSSSKMPVKISYVDSYDKFYIMPLELSTELDTVMKTLEILYSSEGECDGTKSSIPDVLEDPCVSLPCVAKYSEDEAWYRAVITDIEGDNIYVFFVDYGNSEVSSLKNLRPITPELIKIPPIAIECKLYAIQAKEGKDSEITAKLEEYFIDEVELNMEVFQLSQPYMVRLYHGDGDLAEILCQKDLAAEIIPPPETVKELLVDKLNDNVTENLQTTFVEMPNNLSNSIPLRPFADKDELSVSVKFWESENDTIAVYGVPSEIDDELIGFQEKLQVFYNENDKRLSHFNCFDFCVAKYLEDESWYRAQIIAVDGSAIKVKFIDYGNSEVVEPEYISELSPDFSSEPQYAIKFCLSGFKVENDQSETLQEKMEEYVYSENVIVKLCKYLCNVPSACATSLLYGEVDLVEILLTNNLISPRYIVNNQLESKFEATIENVIGDIFYILPVQFAQERDNLQKCLQENCNDTVSSDEIDPKGLYAAKVNEKWSRISILSINDSAKHSFVKCVDYGIETEVELTNLYLLPKDLWHQPLLLHECKIVNLEDAPSHIKAKDTKEVSGCIFVCEMKKSYPVNYPLEMKLFEKDTEENLDTSQEKFILTETNKDGVEILSQESIIVSEETAGSEEKADVGGNKIEEYLDNKELDEIPGAENVESVANMYGELCNGIETCETDSDEKQPESLQETVHDEYVDNSHQAESETLPIIGSVDEKQPESLQEAVYDEYAADQFHQAESKTLPIIGSVDKKQPGSLQEPVYDEYAADQAESETLPIIGSVDEKQPESLQETVYDEYAADQFHQVESETLPIIGSVDEKQPESLQEAVYDEYAVDQAESETLPIIGSVDEKQPESLQETVYDEYAADQFHQVESETLPIIGSVDEKQPESLQEAVYDEYAADQAESETLPIIGSVDEKQPESLQETVYDEYAADQFNQAESETFPIISSGDEILDEKQPESGQNQFSADHFNQAVDRTIPVTDSGNEIASVPECEFDKLSEKSNGSDEKIMSVLESEFLDAESAPESTALSNFSSPEKASKLELDEGELPISIASSDVDFVEKAMPVPESEFLDAESAPESTSLSNSNSPERTSKSDPDGSKLPNDIDLSDSAESDFVAKVSSTVQNTETEKPFTESDEISLDNNFRISTEDVGGALQDHKVENHSAESDDNLPKTNFVEEGEWDERPECDIKQVSGDQECNDSFDADSLSSHESCFKNENSNAIPESHVDLASNETEADLSTVNSVGDSCIEPSCAEFDLTQESSPDVLADVSEEQMIGKVDTYVSDIAISNGSVMLSAIPYDLHVKLMSTLGESLQSVYSKKELGFEQCSVSDLCAVYSDEIWFRGKILEIHEDELTILLIDFGITKTVDKFSVVDLEPEHKKIPPYAVECQLAGVYCPPEKAEDAKNFILELLSGVQGTGKDVSIEVVKDGRPKQVNLYVTGQNVLFGLLLQNLVSQKISDWCLKSGKYNAKTSYIDYNSGKNQLHVNLVEQLDSLQSLRNSMNSSYTLNSEKASALESGVYAVLYKDVWHRGKAISFDDELQLFLVDSGETVPVGELCHLLPEHCIHPPFAILCQLPDNILVTNDFPSAAKEIFAANEFLVDVSMNSDSHDLSAIVIDEVLLEKIESLSSLGQSVMNDTESC